MEIKRKLTQKEAVRLVVKNPNYFLKINNLTPSFCMDVCREAPECFTSVPVSFKTKEFCSSLCCYLGNEDFTEKIRKSDKPVPELLWLDKFLHSIEVYYPGILEEIISGPHFSLNLFRNIPDSLKTEKMCCEAVMKNPKCLKWVPLNCMTQNVCNKAFRNHCFEWLRDVPSRFITKEMAEIAVEFPQAWPLIPEHLQTEELREKVMKACKTPEDIMCLDPDRYGVREIIEIAPWEPYC